MEDKRGLQTKAVRFQMSQTAGQESTLAPFLSQLSGKARQTEIFTEQIVFVVSVTVLFVA
jgi:hypothetical protein